TVSDRAALWVVAPLVPTTWKLVVPVGVVPATVTVSVLLTLPFAGGVTGLAEKPQVAPVGGPVHDRVTALVKPFCEATVQGVVALPPWLADRLVGAHDTVKSGVVDAAGTTERQVDGLEPQASLPLGCATTW